MLLLHEQDPPKRSSKCRYVDAVTSDPFGNRSSPSW